MNNLQMAAEALKKKKLLSPAKKLPQTQTTTKIYQSTAQKILEELQIAIKQERINQHLTQRELANRAQISQATITRAEKHGWISLFSILKIIGALNKNLILN